MKQEVSSKEYKELKTMIDLQKKMAKRLTQLVSPELTRALTDDNTTKVNEILEIFVHQQTAIYTRFNAIVNPNQSSPHPLSF
jgi:hypothetical protein